MKLTLVFCLISLTAFASAKPQCINCAVKADPNEATEILQLFLTRLHSEGGPLYKNIKTNGATFKRFVGTNFNINAVLMGKDGKEKTCKINIANKPWTDTIVVLKIDCPGEKKLSKMFDARELM